MTVSIKTTGRTDIKDLFEKSGLLTSQLTHTPFLAFVSTPDGIEVKLFDRAKELVRDCTAETPVMVQWRGRWSSDFFQMTVADVSAALKDAR